eukprot:683278-Alexandrium_andersonii.AAC.1
MAALECVCPAAKNQLHTSRALLRAWARQWPPRHTVALPWLVAVAMAWHMALAGQARVAGLLLLQWCA